MKIVGRIIYWLAVVAISLALVIGLILFLESRDQSSVEVRRLRGLRLGLTREPSRRTCRANTITRSAAL